MEVPEAVPEGLLRLLLSCNESQTQALRGEQTKGLLMNHQTCDLCGQSLLGKNQVRYELRIEVKAAYGPLEITEEDLAKDLSLEIAKMLQQLEGMSEEEAQNEVYREFEFDLCAACQRRYVKEPLPKAYPSY
jgi:hypothetical protein